MSGEAMLTSSAYPIPRRFPRYQLNVPVRVIAQKCGKPVIAQGRGNELNEGGLAVFAGIEISVDEQVAVEFTPPYTGQPIRVRCVVRNRQGYNYGVKFLLENENDEHRAEEIRSVLRGMGLPI